MTPSTISTTTAIDSRRCGSPLLGACLALLFLFANLQISFAQTPQRSREEDSLVYVAVRYIDAGDFDRARQILNAGAEKFPANSVFKYELAYMLYREEKYGQCRDLLAKLVDAPDTEGLYYQLLGNCHDMLGDPATAIKVYDRGLERFPNFGPLYLERGIMWAKVDSIARAMTYWEEGIARHPSFPSNYFHAARFWMEAKNPGWALLYGEIFLNLEPKGKRADMMRHDLFEMWHSTMRQKLDELGKVDKGRTVKFDGNIFFKTVAVQLDTTNSTVKVPFEFFFNKVLASSVLPFLMEGRASLRLADLHEIRTRFLEAWFDNEDVSSHFAIDLFDRQRKLKEAGLFEVYNYSIFATEANSAEAATWRGENTSRMFELQTWLTDNRIAVDTSRSFVRSRLPGLTTSVDDLEKLQE